MSNLPSVSPLPESIRAAQEALLEGVGAEVAASFPGITRLGGQIVASLYLSEDPQNKGRTMDELSLDLTRSKSNIFANLRALEAAGIVERRRTSGSRHDRYVLRGPYPDVIVGAYVSRLRRVVGEKKILVERALNLLGETTGTEADRLREKLNDLGRKYTLFGQVFNQLGSALDGPIDLEPVLKEVPEKIIELIAESLMKKEATLSLTK